MTKHVKLKIGRVAPKQLSITVNGKRMGPRFALELSTILLEAGKAKLSEAQARTILIDSQSLIHDVAIVNLLPHPHEN